MKETQALFPYPSIIPGELKSGDTFLKMNASGDMKPIYTLQKLPDFDIWVLISNETGKHFYGSASTPVGAFGSCEKSFAPYRKAIENGGVFVEPDARVLAAINKARERFSVNDAVKIAAFMNWTYCLGTINEKAINDILDELVLHAVNQYQNTLRTTNPAARFMWERGALC